jgi:hypothetical protein
MKRLRAFSLIRQQPIYRHEAFLAGLTAAGFETRHGQPWWPVRPGEVLVVWNRYGDVEAIADKFEAQGGTVIVAENAYLGLDREDRQRYALALDAHNGRGRWFPGGPERWQALEAELPAPLAPMRTGGDYVLVAPNRSFGMRGGVMPNDWAERTAQALKAKGEKVRIRTHPGNLKPRVPLDVDLAGASRVEIWSSSVGVEALVRGIPVVCHAPWWICKSRPREEALQALAWAQWSVMEIQTGAAFRHLLRGAEQAQVAAGT